MSSIGPQLPPHLQKRKRTPEEGDGSNSPPSKVTRKNDEEIALDDDSSDDEYGPSTGPASSSTLKAPEQGPSLPPSSKKDKTDRPQPSIGPCLGSSMPPPSHGPSRPSPPAPTGPSRPPPQTYGPTRPPAPLSTRPTTNPEDDSDKDSDDDDDYGPSLPSATAPQTSIFDRPEKSSPQPTASKRDDWMLAPPPITGYQAPDTTKLRARGFKSGPRATAGSSSGPAELSGIWTETPQEKAKRLKDAVLGRGDVTQQPSSAPAVDSRRSEKRMAEEEKIRLFTEQTRGKSLYEQHQAKKEREKKDTGKEVEDDPSKRAFDWEKDMKTGGISGTQRKEMLTKSADFGGRFAKGSYL